MGYQLNERDQKTNNRLISFLLFTVPGSVLIGFLYIISLIAPATALAMFFLWIVCISLPGTFFGIQFFLELFRGLFQTSKHYVIFIIVFLASSALLFLLLQVVVFPTIMQGASIEEQIPAIVFLVLIPALSIAIIIQSLIKNRQKSKNTGYK